MSRLAQVIAHLERFDARSALAAALREWALAPARELEPLVVDLARLARDSCDPLAKTREASVHQAWLAVAERKNPVELAWLLEATPPPPSSMLGAAERSEWLQKLLSLSAFPPDPRLARLAEEHLLSGAAGHTPVDLQVAQLVISAAHANARSVLRGVARNTMRLRAALAPLVAVAEDRFEKPCAADEVARVAVLIAEYGRRRGRARSTLEALFAAVYASPDDDAPRRVLADALLEVDDPRGEYIALAFDPAGADQARALLARLRTGWLKPWRDFLGGVEFARGFPAEATFFDSPQVLAQSLRTLRSVIVKCPDARFLTRDALAGLREVEVTSRTLAEALSQHALPLPWLRLKVTEPDGYATEAAAILRELTAGKVPKLERLTLTGLDEAAAAEAVSFMKGFSTCALELGFASAKACGIVVGAALGSAVSLDFSCNEAQLRGSTRAGALTLLVTSRVPSQLHFISALPQHIERAQVSMPGLTQVSELPSPFDRLLRRAGVVELMPPP